MDVVDDISRKIPRSTQGDGDDERRWEVTDLPIIRGIENDQNRLC